MADQHPIEAQSSVGADGSADLAGLNAAQLEVVQHSTGPLLVVAGAGTGKTMAITRRIAWLINSGQCAPEEMLALTFTDKAAQEMTERIEQRLPLGYPDLWVSTFHAFCQRVLQEHALEIGLPGDFRLLTETDAYLLVRKNLDRFDLDYYRPLGNPNKFIRALLKHFSRAKDEAVRPADYLQYAEELALDADQAESGQAENSRQQELAKAYATYQQLLLDNGCLDLGDLNLYVLDLFADRPAILDRYRQQFKQVVVDEFQDTNWSQYQLIKLLVPPTGNLTVVGDDDQSIYKFRGASISNILQFKHDFPDTREVVLTDNYRSRQGILDAAHGFIQLNNPNRLEAKLQLCKRLTAVREGEAVVEHLRYADAAAEAAGIVDRMLELRQDGTTESWSDFAVLVRSNASAEPVSQELRRRGVPFQFLALRGLYNKPIILDVTAYFQLLDDYHESSAMYRTLASPPFRISGPDLIELVHQSRARSRSIYETVTEHTALKQLLPETHKQLDRLLDMLKQHTELAKDRTVSELFVTYLYESGMADRLRAEESQQAREDASHINQFFSRLKRFEAGSDNPTLAAFMEEFAMERDSGESGGLAFDPETGPDMVRIMTVHAAKGLEFPVVFISQMADKRFPAINRGGDIPLPEPLTKEIVPEGDIHLQEERRLFYVALTRARDRLYLTSAEDYGGKTKRKPSRFVADLGFAETAAGQAAVVLPPPLPQTELPVPELKLPKQFSFTQLAAFDSCPLQYKFAHVLRLPVFGKPQFSFGRTMHLTLEAFLTELKRRGSSEQGQLFAEPAASSDTPTAALPVTLDELMAMYDEHWQDEWYPDRPTKEKYRQKGRDLLGDFYRQCESDPPQVHALEQDFSVKIAGQSVRGQIDRIDRLPDGTVELIDYKTGAAKDPDKLETGPKRQLLLYQVAALRALNLRPSKLTFHYLEGGTRVSFIGQDKDLEKLEDYMGGIIERIKEKDFPPKPGWQCQHCDFRAICEYRQN
jgi:DNA helicase-2/ATP-dependent DNA helicase PcrA